MSDPVVAHPKSARKIGKLEAWRDEQAIKRLAAGVIPDPNAGSQEDFEAGCNILMDILCGKIRRTIKQHSSPTTVYVFRAANGRALYVGVSMTAAARILSHRSRHEGFWWETAHISLEHFPDRRSALNRETELIASLMPVHNIAQGTIK